MGTGARRHRLTPASAYAGATNVAGPHPSLEPGAACPECPKGKVYVQKEPRPLVRIVGQAPLAATVYALEQLRCNACAQLFTAPGHHGGSEHAGPLVAIPTATGV